MAVLLTGATGFIGQWIARLADSAVAPLRVLVRPQSDLSLLAGLNVELVTGDLGDVASLRRAVEGVTHIIHAAGLISFRAADRRGVFEVNARGLANLLAVAQDAQVEKIVYTASIFAKGHAVDPARPVTESASFNAPELLDIPYVWAKLDAHKAVEEFIQAGLPIVRLYPGLCLGPGDMHRSSSASIEQWLHGRLPAIIGGGGISFMDVRDAAEAHWAALARGVPGEEYLATGHNVTLEALFDRLARIVPGRRVPLVVRPNIGISAMRLAEKLGVSLPIESDQARLMAYCWWQDSTRAQRELGVRFRPLEDTLADTIAWFRENPPAWAD